MIEAVCFRVIEDNRTQKLWDYVVLNFAPNEIYMMGESPKWMLHKSMKRAKNIKTADELPDLPLIMIQPRNAKVYKGEISLSEFQHPEKAIYFFGADDSDTTEEHLGSRVPDALVYIPTSTDDQMYAPMAYAVVAWDQLR